MKKIICVFLSFAIFFSFCTTAYAQRELIPEDTSIYENEAVNVFNPVIIEAMANADSYIEKIATPSDFDLQCTNAILIETSTGQVLYEKNADEQVAIASITKVMTMLLVIEQLKSGKFTLSDIVPISNHAFSMGGSQIWLEPGEVFTVDELLKAVAVSSANDAAVALAEFVAGSEEAFCGMMNERARQLGMNNTNFVNACGLDAQGHYSTARDVSIMASELIKHPEIFEYTTIWVDYLRDGETQIVNTNKLLQSYPGITGLKTGTTSGAGVCLTASAVRDGMSLISVVLGSNSSQERFSASKKLLDFGFTNFETKPFPDTSNIPLQVDTKNALNQTVGIEFSVPQNLLFVKASTSNLSYQVDLASYIQAPMQKGMKVGSISLYTETEKIGEYDIVLSEDVEKMDFSNALALLTKYIGQM